MEKGFCVGYSRAVINPDESIPLSGFGNDSQRFHTRVTEDFCGTCVALTDEADTTVLVVATDLVIAHPDLAQEIRETLSQETGVPEERIYVAGTHSHSAPSMGWTDLPAIQKYKEKMVATLARVAGEAMADRKPATLFVGSIETEKMNFIKHYKVRANADGAISYIGDCFGTIKGKIRLEHSTKVDPTLHLVKFVREGGKDVVLANFRAHPHFTGGTLRYDLSSDYIGAFRMALEAVVDCHAVYLQGACGNINSSTRMDAEAPFTTCRSYGMGLAGYAIEGLEKYMTQVPTGRIHTKQLEYYGEINHAMDHLAEKAAEIGKEWNTNFDHGKCVEMGEPYGIRSPYHAEAIVWNSERTKEQHGKLVLNAVAVGDALAFVTYPGEMFDSISVRMEENSPFRTTLMLCYCHDHTGYLPSAVAYKYTSYETDITRFQAGTGEQVADTYVAMLKELKTQ